MPPSRIGRGGALDSGYGQSLDLAESSEIVIRGSRATLGPLYRRVSKWTRSRKVKDRCHFLNLGASLSPVSV